MSPQPVARAVALAVCLMPGIAAAQEAGSKIQLVAEDGFVVRSIKILLKGGDAVPSVKTIASVDAQAGIVHTVDLLGRAQEIKLSDIDRIECAQTVRKQSPAAQEPAWKIEVLRGAVVTTTTPMLDVEDGVLTVKNLSAPKQMTWEVRTIRYQSGSRMFELALLPVRYEKQYIGGGGGGLSGGRKGLP